MPTLAFLDHSFHTKSKATAFLVELLRRHFEVETYWDESWNNGPRINHRDVASKRYDAIIIFQMVELFTPAELKRLNCDNIIIVPMYDAHYDVRDLLWLRYRTCKFLCFSKTLHAWLRSLGIDSAAVQYFIESAPEPKTGIPSGLNGFFWQRTSDITWDQIKILISGTKFDQFHIHCVTDPPGYTLVMPSEAERETHRITFSEWFPKKMDYMHTLEQASVFFAPRLQEGIGMSFLEAMAKGKCVVAPDNPTMNEYIEHGVNGLLYDPDHPSPLDFSDVHTLGARARETCAAGYRKWIGSEGDIFGFINRPLRYEKQTDYLYFYSFVKEAFKLSRFRKKI